jgi:hypothetical protein
MVREAGSGLRRSGGPAWMGQGSSVHSAVRARLRRLHPRARRSTPPLGSRNPDLGGHGAGLRPMCLPADVRRAYAATSSLCAAGGVMRGEVTLRCPMLRTGRPRSYRQSDGRRDVRGPGARGSGGGEWAWECCTPPTAWNAAPAIGRGWKPQPPFCLKRHRSGMGAPATGPSWRWSGYGAG